MLKHKLKSLLFEQPYSIYENKICRDYRDGIVTKEQLDRCSTCDRNAKIYDGLSETSKAQLIERTGEEIVDEDILQQIEGEKNG